MFGKHESYDWTTKLLYLVTVIKIPVQCESFLFVYSLSSKSSTLELQVCQTLIIYLMNMGTVPGHGGGGWRK